MNKLRQEKGNYLFTKTKKFTPCKASEISVGRAFDFAYDMTFGSKGEHRDHRSGGAHLRKKGEIFSNTFQGKLGEYIVWMVMHQNGCKCSEVDTQLFGLGKWDDVDLVCNNKTINIKSIPFFGNLFLLETKDWNTKATYIPNNKNYDFHICVRVKPDIKGIMRNKRMFYSNDMNRDVLYKVINEQNWMFDIPGFANNSLLVKAIQDSNILPKGALLNGKTKMDATNYYIQTGDLEDIKLIKI